jgi:hypothetical protein
MTFTGLAVAAGATALATESDEAGSDKRAVDFELLDAGQELAADQGGMFWNSHGEILATQGAGMD